ncbi:MAG: rRNA pseudouridine synthase [Bacteroidales bacterium]|nr:rRNA pseudouridine synthase [Bacteroidales bacterium]
MAERQGKSRTEKYSKSSKSSKDGSFSKYRKKVNPKANTMAKQGYSRAPKKEATTIDMASSGPMRLNKFIAHAGVCSRREADKLIETGVITVNHKIVSELGYKVQPEDKVHMDGQLLVAEKLQYVLLNKPKGFVTTTDDPQERKTVMDLIARASDERIYPVGRLDIATTGLLLFTNDGDLAKKLTHPKHRVRKVYHVFLDKPLTKYDMTEIVKGFELEDGPINVDKISYVDGDRTKKEVGIQIHSGRNRIVRRIFEHLDYEVTKLDRVVFGGLTKKDLPRGKWKKLSSSEIDFLKMI